MNINNIRKAIAKTTTKCASISSLDETRIKLWTLEIMSEVFNELHRQEIIEEKERERIEQSFYNDITDMCDI